MKSPSRVAYSCGKFVEMSGGRPGAGVPSVYAVLRQYEGHDGMAHPMEAAHAIIRAWRLGDRYMLDTQEAKDAVSMLAGCLEDGKAGSEKNGPYCAAISLIAIRNEINRVCLESLSYMGRSEAESEVCALRNALYKAASSEGWGGWSEGSRYRKVFMCLKKKTRGVLGMSAISMAFLAGRSLVYDKAEEKKAHDELSRVAEDLGASGASGDPSFLRSTRYYSLMLGMSVDRILLDASRSLDSGEDDRMGRPGRRQYGRRAQ